MYLYKFGAYFHIILYFLHINNDKHINDIRIIYRNKYRNKWIQKKLIK